MPWPKEHKRETQDKIVRAAAAAFREHGITAVSVGDVMERAGLTHGGFYSHFRSKEDLIAKTLSYASDQTSEMLSHAQTGGAASALLAEAMMYLSEQHATHPERGCPIAALGPELSRSGERVRRTLADEIAKRLAHLRDLVASRVSASVRKRRAAGVCATMVGGIIIARALEEPERSQFLSDCRGFLNDALAEE